MTKSEIIKYVKNCTVHSSQFAKNIKINANNIPLKLQQILSIMIFDETESLFIPDSIYSPLEDFKKRWSYNYAEIHQTGRSGGWLTLDISVPDDDELSELTYIELYQLYRMLKDFYKTCDKFITNFKKYALKFKYNETSNTIEFKGKKQ